MMNIQLPGPYRTALRISVEFHTVGKQLTLHKGFAQVELLPEKLDPIGTDREASLINKSCHK